jgi:hypothetical protein
VIKEEQLKEIKPQAAIASATASHVVAGIPIPKVARVKIFSPEEWEQFVEEWASSLESLYLKVRRLAGAGDFGVDIAGFKSANGFQGPWDNYQCKRYAQPLRPSDIWVELGKIIYYSHRKEFIAPERHYFVCSQGVGTTLEKLLNNTDKLKEQARSNWEKHCKAEITSTAEVPLDGELLEYFDAFDFSIFSSKSTVELIERHALTAHHAVRFGGGLPPRPPTGTPPTTPSDEESRYIRHILDAYGEHLGEPITAPDKLISHETLNKDFLRQRERFYNAEALRNFARDTVPDGTFAALQDEIYHGVVDIHDGTHAGGFDRMKATLAHAAHVAATANPLSPATKTQDRQGICHQLANEDRLIWVVKDE